MVKIRLSPRLAVLLISPRESPYRSESLASLEEGIQEGKWEDIPPIWLTPNLGLNGLFNGLRSGEWHPTLKPFMIYNGHNRFQKALEHNLPIVAYVRYTPGNPRMPEQEKLREQVYH